jgi:CHAD domain-containing protein
MRLATAATATHPGYTATMAFRLSRREPPTEGARRLADDELAAAIARLRGEEGGPDQRVHAARKSIKRVRALLRLLRSSMRKERFAADNAALRDAARGLSAARDAAVAISTFDLLVPVPDPLLTAVRLDLVARSGDSGATPDDATLHAAADALATLRPRLVEGLGVLDWDVVAAGLGASYAGGRAAMRAAFADLHDEAFHGWRKRAKDLWYQAQVLEGSCPPQLRALTEQLAELGDQLGEDHDLAVLAAAAAASPALGERLNARHAQLRRAAWQLGRRIYAERPRAFLRRMRVYWQVWREGETAD